MDSITVTFWSRSIKEMETLLKSDLTKGLSAQEARFRQRKSGTNTISESRHVSDLHLLFDQFKSPFMALLLFADVLSFYLGEHVDAIIIFCIIVLSGVLSFWQERRAQSVVKSLLDMVKVTAKVWREGKELVVALEEVVLGDIVLLSAGDIVPADALLIEANDLFINESMLTGEPFPEEKTVGILAAETILKDRNNSVFKGTHVTSGFAKVLVVVTGKRTEFGQIAEKIKPNKGETEFERGLRHFGYMLMEIALLLALIIFATNIYLDKPFIDSLLFSLSLTIGITPFLLPAIVSINLAYGASHMATQKVIVKRLIAIENFGSMNVFCSDKTGTLTSGEIRVHDYLDVSKKKNDRILDLAYINATLQTGYTNPIDAAIKDFHKMDMTVIPKLDEIPFDFTRKRLSVLVEENGGNLMIIKGTYKKVMEVCTFADNKGKIQPLETHRKEIDTLFETSTKKGLRVIALAYKNTLTKKITKADEADMVFLGMLFLDDPVKEGVLESVQEMKRMGIQLKILTGDNKNVSQYVGKQLGIAEKKVLTGSELHKLDDTALSKKVGHVDIFSELEPSQKERIVRLLSQAGNVVGYIGDGVNDVAAIQAADVGISVENAVDIAKGTADFVLLEKDLQVLLNGIIEGRKTFINTMKYIFMSTSANFGNIMSMAAFSLFLPFLPLLPKQILASNFISDLPAMAIPTDNVDDDWVELPKKWNLGFIKKFMIRFGLLSSIFDFLTFGILMYILKSDADHFRSGWFLVAILTQFSALMVLRSKKVFYKSRPGNLILIITMAMFLIGFIIPYSPLGTILELLPIPIKTVAMLLGVVILYVIANEFMKRFFYRKFNF
ncbi:MAG TPA: magnesium-translocating P-type ATPase [Arenibacter sp.]|nr:magnesium-translocating P-type ATPase [Arenibacter sp.]